MTRPDPPDQRALERVRAVLHESARLKQAVLADCADVVARAGERVAAAFAGGGRVLLFGNGGSAADAQHIAAEWTGRYVADRRALDAIALPANPPHGTAVANDYGFERVFARGVEAHGRPGDVAIAISTSGRSPNVLAGAEAAREGGLTTIALTGKGGGALAGLADLWIAVPSDETPRIQEAHIAILHAICEVVEDGLGS